MNAVVEIFVQYTLLPRSYGALLVDTVVGTYVAMETAGGIYIYIYLCTVKSEVVIFIVLANWQTNILLLKSCGHKLCIVWMWMSLLLP